MAKLEEALNDPAIRDEAGNALRGLIDNVVLTPDAAAPNGLRAELRGDLASILALWGNQNAPGLGHRGVTFLAG